VFGVRSAGLLLVAIRLRSHTPSLHVGLTVASIGTLGLAGTYCYLMWRDGRAGVFFTLFIAPFLLMGALLGFFGIRGLLRLARFGSWVLVVPGRGGQLGVPLDVTLLPTREVTPSGELQCRLRCLRSTMSRTSGAGASRPSDNTALWEEEWTLGTGILHPRMGVALTLPFPDEGQATDVDRTTGAGIRWQLNVVVPTKDFSHEAMFEIPVRER